MYHFAPRFPVSSCIPPPSSAPANRGTFPRGKVLAVTFSRYHSTGDIPKALREREDDILPYRDGAKTSPGRAGKLLDSYTLKLVTKKGEYYKYD